MKTPRQIFGDKKLWQGLTSSLQLDTIAKDLNLPHWRGAVSRDLMRGGSTPLQRESWILNIQHSTQGNGTHWVALVRDGKRVFYCDSYGSPPVDEVFERYGPDLEYVSSTFPLQPIDNPSVQYCGPFALYILYTYWTQGRNFFDTILNVRDAYGEGRSPS